MCYTQTKITFSVLCQLFHVNMELSLTQMLAVITRLQTNQSQTQLESFTVFIINLSFKSRCSDNPSPAGFPPSLGTQE